jgi:uncharacterized membrane protein
MARGGPAPRASTDAFKKDDTHNRTQSERRPFMSTIADSGARAAERQTRALPVRRIRLADVGAALSEGVRDYRVRPTHYFFTALIYPVAGLLALAFAVNLDLLRLLFPIVAGFALVGPIAATGVYELSRRLERGEPATWKSAFEAALGPSRGPVFRLGLVLLAIFLSWLYAADFLWTTVMGGAEPEGVGEFLTLVLTTPEGRTLMVVGHLVGALFAGAAFAVSVVSFQAIVDRAVSARAGVLTSLAAIGKNPVPMAVWAATIAVILAVASAPLLVGLIVALPVLAHASWRMYRRVVAD